MKLSFSQVTYIWKSGRTLLFTRFIAMSLGYLFLLVISNRFGAESIGLFTLSLTIANILTILSLMGLDGGLLKFIPQLITQEKIAGVKNLYFLAVVISLPFSMLVSLALLGSSDFLAFQVFQEPLLKRTFVPIALAIPLMTLYKINVVTLRSAQKFTSFAFFNDLSVYLFALFFVTLGISHNVEYPFFAYVGACLVSCALIIATVRKLNFFQLTSHESVIKWKRLISISAPLLLLNSVALIMTWADTLMIGVFRPVAEVGIYTVALKLATLASIVNVVILSLLGPKISSDFAAKRFKSLNSTILSGTIISLVATTTSVLLLLAIGDKLLLWGFGAEFTDGYWPMVILGITITASSFGGLLTVFLNISSYQKTVLSFTVIFSILNLILNSLFIPAIGIKGAAIATTISNTALNLILSFIAISVLKKNVAENNR